MVNEIELWVCDDCDAIEIVLGSENVVCMECEKPMQFVKFYRQPTKRAVDSPEPCGNYTPAFLIKGSPCLNCDADAASH